MGKDKEKINGSSFCYVRLIFITLFINVFLRGCCCFFLLRAQHEKRLVIPSNIQ